MECGEVRSCCGVVGVGEAFPNFRFGMGEGGLVVRGLKAGGLGVFGFGWCLGCERKMDEIDAAGERKIEEAEERWILYIVRILRGRFRRHSTGLTLTEPKLRIFLEWPILEVSSLSELMIQFDMLIPCLEFF